MSAIEFLAPKSSSQPRGGNDNISSIDCRKIKMSQKDGFSTGFLLGSIVGGLVGGTIGVLLANRQQEGDEPEVLRRVKARAQNKGDRAESIGSARQSLEDKIADLNGAIDEVRSSLSAVQLEPPLELDRTHPQALSIETE
jgi:gas vesicle protein